MVKNGRSLWEWQLFKKDETSELIEARSSLFRMNGTQESVSWVLWCNFPFRPMNGNVIKPWVSHEKKISSAVAWNIQMMRIQAMLCPESPLCLTTFPVIRELVQSRYTFLLNTRRGESLFLVMWLVVVRAIYSCSLSTHNVGVFNLCQTESIPRNITAVTWLPLMSHSTWFYKTKVGKKQGIQQGGDCQLCNEADGSSSECSVAASLCQKRAVSSAVALHGWQC
jgi:hypothetical protein